MLPFHLQYILYGKSSGLFIRPVYAKKVNMFNFKMKDFKLLNTAGWRTNVRIEKVTKSMNMEQEPFKKDYFYSYGILTILRSNYLEERVMSTLLVGIAQLEDNASINTKLIHFTMCTTYLVQPPQHLQVAIVDNDEYLHLYIVPLQEYFVEVFVKNQTYVLLKSCTVDKQYLYRYCHNICNTSTVSLI